MVPLKILVLSRKDIHHPRAGGAEIVLHKYMLGLVVQGHHVTQIAPLFPGALRRQQIDGIQVKRMFGIHTIYFLFWSWYVRHGAGKFDLIIDHAGGIPLLSPLYARRTKIVLLIHHLGTQEWTDYFQQKRRMGWLGKCCLWIYNTFVLSLYKHKMTITVSQGTAKELQAHGFDKVTVIPNSTDMPLISFADIVPKKNVLTIIGRIIPNKQMDHAITILHALRVQDPTWELNIIWYAQDANEYASLQSLVHSLWVAWSVHFHGKLTQQELIPVLDTTKYLLITSDKEWFGLTALEANRRGVPVIAYSIPGVDEVVHHWTNGYLVPKNNWESIVTTIQASEDTYTKLVSDTHQAIHAYPTRDDNIKTFVSLLFA